MDPDLARARSGTRVVAVVALKPVAQDVQARLQHVIAEGFRLGKEHLRGEQSRRLGVAGGRLGCGAHCCLLAGPGPCGPRSADELVIEFPVPLGQRLQFVAYAAPFG
jgi:hypothetical protein